MNVYSFLRVNSGASYYPFSSMCRGFVKAPDEHDFGDDINYLPLVFDETTVAKTSFASAASWISRRYYDSATFQKMTIGKNTGGDNTIYVNPRCAFSIDRNRHKHLLYVLGEKPQQNSYNTHYKLIASPQFILDTKNLWCNGFKTHVLSFISSLLEIEVDSNIERYVLHPDIPRSADYQEDISKFLKSKEALDYVDACTTR